MNDSNSVLKYLKHRFSTIVDLESSGRLILFSPLVGVVAGLSAALFFYLLFTLQEFAMGQVMGYHQPPAGTEGSAHPEQLPLYWWAVILVPTIGGLLSGLIVYGFAPEAEGHGTDAMVRAFHRLGGRIRARVPFVKTVASILTIGTGGSAGREGPIAQVGAGFGAYLAKRLGMSERERRLLMLSGAAGGIGAIFRAPLGGALFVSEVLYSSTAFEFQAFVPAVISSVTAYTVFSTIYGQGVAITASSGFVFDNPIELPFYVFFALLCSLVGYFYVTFFYGLRDRVFRLIKVPNGFKPAIGGLVVGLMALELPQVMAGGYGWIQKAVDGNLPILTMAVLCLAKIVATSFTISSGGSGGVFAPSLFIGAMLGGAYGQFCNGLFPGMIEHPEAFVLVGMGGFFAGVAKVPLTSLLMVCEMSGSYGLLVPLMLVCIVNVAVLSPHCSLYEEQVHSLIDSPAHQGDFVVDVLEQIRVKDVLDRNRHIDVVPETMPLAEILRLISTSPNSYFPVVDPENHLVGIFSLRDVRSALVGHTADHLIIASDIATNPVLTVCPDDDLHEALRKFTRKNIDDIPVVDAEEPTRVVGMLTRKALIGAYDRQVAALSSA